MSEWQLLKFKDLFSIPLRNGLTKPSRVRGSGLRMVNMKEIFGYNFIDDKTPMELVPISENEKSSMLAFNDLLFARQSLVESGAGKIAIFKGNEPTVFESHLIRCRLDLEKGFADFIYYLFKSSTGRGAVSTIVQQVAAAGIRGSDLQELTFNIPPLPEQKAIAAVLSSLDDKIDLLHRQNKTLEAMAETLFRQWFIEEAKEDWEEKPLANIVKVIDNRGKTPPYQEYPTAFPIIEVNALCNTNRMVNYSVIRKYVSEETYETWFRGHPKKYDILISTVGSVGELSMYLIDLGCVAQNVVALSPRGISPFYLYQSLYNLKGEIKELDIGSVQPSIKVPHLLSIMIKIPPLELLDNYDEQAKRFVSKITNNSLQIQTLEKLRDNLLPKLMSGEVRVSYEQQDAA